jgi:hypothetical protein
VASIHPRTSRTGATTYQVRWREAGRQTSREAKTEPEAEELKAKVEAGHVKCPTCNGRGLVRLDP